MILSEARKYGLNLTVANQYVAQMTDSVRDAVFGNVGTTISFRVSPDDAPVLVKQFEPTFEEGDIIQLNNRHFVISMIIDGEKVPAFSATTLSIPSTPADNFERIVAHSREYYARPRMEVEAEIRETIEQSEKYKRELADSGRQEQPKMVINSIRKQKLSPNAAEGRESLGLKDLARMVAENQSKVEVKPAKATKPEKPVAEKAAKASSAPREAARSKTVDAPTPQKSSRKKSKKRGKKGKMAAGVVATSSPVAASPTPVKTSEAAVNKPQKATHPTPVHPEVEYQEKSTVDIKPTHKPVNLEKPIERTERFAEKDNSVDGFLAIRH